MKKFETEYGYFNHDGVEFVITNFKTPKPWVNVITNGDYGCVVSQTGGGFSWKEHSEFNRLNRWHQDMIRDDWGKYFYFKNEDTGEVWSPTWMPVKAKLTSFHIRYGLGYTVFETVYKGVSVRATLFVPIHDNCEIWHFSVQNKTKKPLRLSVYSYFEWCLGSSADHHREFHKSFIETDYIPKYNALTAYKRLWEIPLGDRGHWNIDYQYRGFVACTTSVVDYDGDKESFIGQYGSAQNPAGVGVDSLACKTGKWNDSVGVIRTRLNIDSDQHGETAFLIGIQKDTAAIGTVVAKYRKKTAITSALAEVKAYWSDLLGSFSISTPDAGMNILVNKWLRYQAIAGRLMARTAYYQQSGAFGFRDQLQDSLVYLPIRPELTKKQIQLHARHQFQDGTVLHWWHPISETGLATKMTDDLLWLPFVIGQYLDETDDYTILNVKEPFYDHPGSVSLFEHCTRAIDKVLERFSSRGLPLIGAGDWNDGLSAVGLDMKGESIWLAEFLFGILQRFSQIALKHKKPSVAEKYLKHAALLQKAFEKYAWDGKWYFRATKDTGEKIGSATNKEGKIFLNAQTWSVITGIAEPKRQTIAMDAVKKHLLKKNGALLLSPAYSKPDTMIGYLSRYAPGRRENGGVYSHAATWAIWAFAKLKDQKNAYNAYQRLSPIQNGMNPNEYVAEPYVTPGNIDGPESPNYGMGGWTWYTGSASWYQKVITDWILGVRATEEGLLLDPCVPGDWKEYTVNRTFRGSACTIIFLRTSVKSDTITSVIVNGKKIEGTLIKPTSPRMIIEVFI